jgi:uncharacterized membrane protein
VLRAATPERLSAFSDAVFAVLITVLVLRSPAARATHYKALLLLWPTWLSYAVSYLFTGLGVSRFQFPTTVRTKGSWFP